MRTPAYRDKQFSALIDAHGHNCPTFVAPNDKAQVSGIPESPRTWGLDVAFGGECCGRWLLAQRLGSPGPPASGAAAGAERRTLGGRTVAGEPGSSASFSSARIACKQFRFRLYIGST